MMRLELQQALQQSQEDYAYRQRVQADAARNTLHVGETDMKRRIQRVATSKQQHSPVELSNALISFVLENVTDVNMLWKLMCALDDMPTPPKVQQQHSVQQQNLVQEEGSSLRVAQPPVEVAPTVSQQQQAVPVAQQQPQLVAYQEPPAVLAVGTTPPLTYQQPQQLQQPVSLQPQPKQQQQQYRDAALSLQQQQRVIVEPPRSYTPPQPFHVGQTLQHRPTTPPSSRMTPEGRLLSPEVTVLPSSQPASHQQQPVPLAGDALWEQRMEKIQERKRMIDNLLAGNTTR